MKKIAVKPLLGILLTLSVSCSVRYTYITMQVLNPSDTTLPPNTTKLHIMDKCKGEKMVNSLSGICVNGKNQTIFDTTLASVFSESPTFKNIPFVVQKWHEFKNEMKNTPAKGHILLTSSYMVDVDTIIEEESYLGFYHYLPYEYVVTYKLKVELLDAENLKRYNSYIYKDSDSFDWEEQVVRGRTVRLNIMDLLAYTEIAAAQKYASHIATYWTTEERMLYAYPDSLMVLGYDRFQENDLEGAIGSWETAYDTRKVKIKAYAAYDIALAYEMLDDLDECEQWLLKSKKIKKKLPVVDYLKIIKFRKANKLKLDRILKN